MKRYTRKDKLTIQNKCISVKDDSHNNKFLAYCNWSFVKDKQLTLNEAIAIFDNFQIEKSPIYVRIFNEMPRSILEKFVERNNIDKNKIKSIYSELIEKTSYKMEEYEWYN